jgi:cell division protein FtsQ
MAAIREKVTRDAAPLRRAQTRDFTTVKNGGRAKRTSAVWAHRAKWLAICGLLGAAVWMGVAFARSGAFALAHVEISGCERLPSANIERAVRQYGDANTLTLSLPDLQRQLETITQVRHAHVTRVLPDTLRIAIEERKPALLARIEGRADLAWLDEDGVILGSYDPATDPEPPAIAAGFASDRTESERAENRERIKAYKNFMWAIDGDDAKLAARLEEIDLSHPEDVRVQMSGTRVVIQLGGEDYRARLVQALAVLDALQKRDANALARISITDPRILERAARVNFVNVVNPTQISLGFARDESAPASAPPPPSAPRAAALSAATARDKKRR